MDAPLQGNTANSAATACDLSGRWLSTVHKVTDALGQLQYVHTYDYYEIEQQGDRLVFTFGPAHRTMREQIDQNREVLETLATKLAGRRTQVATVQASAAAETPTEPTDKEEAEEQVVEG